jgi:Mrp family chromosome partitioning ATPase
LPVLNALREYHDYVVVDCPCVARAADAAVLGRAADGVLLVVRVGQTSSPSLSAALEALVDTPVVGCLLNDHDGPSRTPPTRGRAAPARAFSDEE